MPVWLLANQLTIAFTSNGISPNVKAVNSMAVKLFSGLCEIGAVGISTVNGRAIELFPLGVR